VQIARAIAVLILGAASAVWAAPQQKLPLSPVRHSESDLEVTGLLGGLPAGSDRFAAYKDLASLPSVTVTVASDENFAMAGAVGVKATGVPLRALARALDAAGVSDMISARCSDGYEAHYPAAYIAAHQPLFVLKLDGLSFAEWGKAKGGFDLGPYMITHENYVPAFSVRAHQDKMQDPSEVVRLDFTTEARVYGAIAPRGPHRKGEDQQAGFLIARQNCLRCHAMSGIGGVKARRSWLLLSRLAVDDPVTFEAYVHDPKSVNPRATMPGNPEYDGPTLAALTAYFKTFSED
jgi:mono/diheme cytochrome c family protein